jgi:hypothetical protein
VNSLTTTSKVETPSAMSLLPASAGRPIAQPGQTRFNKSEAESVQLAAESGFWDAGSPRRQPTIMLAELCHCTSVQITAVEATNIEAIDLRPHRQAGC